MFSFPFYDLFGLSVFKCNILLKLLALMINMEPSRVYTFKQSTKLIIRLSYNHNKLGKLFQVKFYEFQG